MKASRHRTIQDYVLEYLREHANISIHTTEVERAIGLRGNQAAAALHRLAERYPELGVSRVRKGIYRWSDPFPAECAKPDVPGPPPRSPGSLPTLEANAPGGDPAMGQLFEVVGFDTRGFPILQAEDGTREMVLMCRSTLNGFLALAKDQAQIEAFKASLRHLTQDHGNGHG
ncbi:MAG: hypothetical protein JW990_00160 [Thermoleophilia bacterium]|nr:hypothetical protein [Thermoleophilia bacterium]